MSQKIYNRRNLYLIIILGLFLPLAFPAAILAQTTGSWQTVNPASGSIIGREENSYVSTGSKFYLLGGRGIVSVQEYNPATKTWINKAKPPVEINHFQAVTLNGLIYAVGAMNGPYPDEVPLQNIYVYSPSTDKWSTGATIPSTRRRGAAGAVVYHSKIYVVGGITHGHVDGWVNWFDEYDPATNTWKTLPNAPRVRDHFQAVVVNDKLYVAGGRRSAYPNTFNATIPEVDVYDFITAKWSTLSNNFPIPRAGSANVALGNEVIVIGGESNLQVAAHKETHALNTTTNTWRRLADLQSGRHGTGAVVFNQEIYTAAGAGERGGTPKVLTQEKFSMPSQTTAPVTSFTLVNATADTDIQTLTSGAVINLAKIPGKSVNVRANTSTGVGSVVFNLSGQQSKSQTESTAPYSLFGDVSGDYNNWTPTVGTYTLKATPYSASGGTGTAGTSLTISFSVTDQATATATAQRSSKEGDILPSLTAKAYPNPGNQARFNVLLSKKVEGEVSYTLISLTGNKVGAGKLSLKKPTLVLTFDFADKMIARGVYFLNIENKDQKASVRLLQSK